MSHFEPINVVAAMYVVPTIIVVTAIIVVTTTNVVTSVKWNDDLHFQSGYVVEVYVLQK